MCELLVRVRDKSNPDDPYLDAKLTKRGDVIVVVENGHGWGKEELKNPDWRILKLPNVTVEQALTLLQPEVVEDPTDSVLMLQRRGFKLNIEGVAASSAFKTWLADDARANPSRSYAITGAALQALVVKKPKLRDPNVFEAV